MHEIKNSIIYKKVPSIHPDVLYLEKIKESVESKSKEKIDEEIKLINIGLSGEKSIEYELRQFPEEIIVLNDLNFYNPFNALSAQIDFVILTTKCIIVIESKKLTGTIKINKKDEFIRIIKDKDGNIIKKVGMYSPITQNEYHKNALHAVLENLGICVDAPIKSLVVISNPSAIIHMNNASIKVQEEVVKVDQLNHKIHQILSLEKKEYYKKEELLTIAKWLVDNQVENKLDYFNSLGLKKINS